MACPNDRALPFLRFVAYDTVAGLTEELEDDAERRFNALDTLLSSFSLCLSETGLSGSAYGVGDSGIADKPDEAVFAAVKQGRDDVEPDDNEELEG